jgi:hypothetical protein
MKLKKVAIAIAAVLVLLIAAAFIVPPLLFKEPGDWSKVVSIEGASDYQSPAALDRAWALPVAATYKAKLDYQRNPSFCGPTSVVNVVRSFGGEADQATVLEGTQSSTVFGILPGGITLDALGELVRARTGKTVTVLRDFDLALFRQHLMRTNDPGYRFIANFSRAPLFGRGGGHHSPIGGYLAPEDLVLVIDVNAKFKPWLVKADRLYEAINTVDRASGQKRGLLEIH